MLIWSPVCDGIADVLSEDPLKFIIAPFIQEGALASLLGDIKVSDEFEVITRWRPEDISSGVSDPEVFNFLAENNYKLWIHNDIHLKLLITESDQCFVGSANITGRGLGLSSAGNVEAGHWCTLEAEDIQELHALFGESRIVTQQIYELVAEHKRKSPAPTPRQDPFEFPDDEKPFTLLSLPAIENPQRFLILAASSDFKDDDERHRFLHDCALLSLGSSSPNNHWFVDADSEDVLISSFAHFEFAQELSDLLEEEKSMHFGRVTSWIHDRCEEVPLPYRWEVKEAVNRLYNWLQFCFDEISWDQPNISQILRWNDVGPFRRRVDADLPEEIQEELLMEAIHRIDQYGIEPHHDSTDYDVIVDDKRYPPIPIVAFAIESKYGCNIPSGHIRGGSGTRCFSILEKAGFNIVKK